MKVKAKQTGFYGNKRRYEGDIFEVDPKQFSERWMDKELSAKESPSPKSVRGSDKDKEVI